MSNFLDFIKSPKDLVKLNKMELNLLADEIRGFLIKSVSKTGGHLASNLGVVELTIAIHKVFESPKDKVIWDVGHQSYIHKILTGRKDKFNTLRKFKGLSGFPKRSESIHDIYETGHTSTSLSAALGIAGSRDLNKENYNIVAVIGDGALTGGQAFEALNNIGESKKDIIIILNDNGMSISENVGWVAKYLNKLRTGVLTSDVKKKMGKIIEKIPTVGDIVKKTYRLAQDGLDSLYVPGKIFENMGITYLGVIDGHNISEIINVLEKCKKIKGPKIIHVNTIKGKGYSIAERVPSKYHGVSAFDIETGKVINKSSNVKTYSEVFGEKITKMADKNDKIVAITAAMPGGTKLNKFMKMYPDRFFDVGIAEQHAITFAAGLAIGGMKPYIAIYSTFLQRAYDQLMIDVCMQNLPIVLCIDRSGIVGADGETHQGIFDLSYLSTLPNMCIASPKDRKEFLKMLKFSEKYKGPIAIRYPRGKVFNYKDDGNQKIKYGKWEIIREYKSNINDGEVAIIATGKMVENIIGASDKLIENGVNHILINARFINPIDEDMLLDIGKIYKKIYVIEDNIVHGGLGTRVIDFYNNSNIENIRVVKCGYPVEFIEHGSQEELYKKYKLDSKGIYKTILEDK